MALEKTHRFLLTGLLHWLSFVTARTPVYKSTFALLKSRLFSLPHSANTSEIYVKKGNYPSGI